MKIVIRKLYFFALLVFFCSFAVCAPAAKGAAGQNCDTANGVCKATCEEANILINLKDAKNDCNDNNLFFNTNVCCKKTGRCDSANGECRSSCDEGNIIFGLKDQQNDCNINNWLNSEVCCKKGNPSDAGTPGQPPASTSAPPSSSASSRGDSTASGLVPCNTNCTLCHLVIGFKRIFDFFISLLFVATMLAITISGVFYMVSTGSKKLIEMAKTALTYSLMAFVIGMGSWIIVNTVMVGLGYKHPQGGKWWEFTCDTSKSTGPTGSGSGSSGSGGKPDSGGGQQNTEKGDGTCGGVAVQQNSDQCDLTSKELDNTLACINQKMSGSSSGNFDNPNLAGFFANKALAGSFVVTSLGLNKNLDWQQKCVGDNYAGKGYCSHVQYSCHFGGRDCQGQVNAADLAGGNLSSIAAAAKECNTTGTVLYGDASHTNHVHVSVNNGACDCR